MVDPDLELRGEGEGGGGVLWVLCQVFIILGVCFACPGGSSSFCTPSLDLPLLLEIPPHTLHVYYFHWGTFNSLHPRLHIIVSISLGR